MAWRDCRSRSRRSFHSGPPHHPVTGSFRSSAAARAAIKSFILFRNINLILSGSRGFILAHLLGPAGYGVLGSLIALQQMLSYGALGVREGVLIKLSKPEAEQESVGIYTSAIAFAAGVGLLVPVAVTACAWFVQGRFEVNYLLIGLIGGMSILNEVLVNINRHEHRLIRVSVCESSYNLSILLLVFALQNYLTVTLALSFVLAGVSLSVIVYVTTLSKFSLREFSRHLVTELISLGFLSSVLSAVLLVVNLGFILVAQRHLSNEEMGQFVFASNIATVLLVSLNAFSWAMTSRSMRDLAERSEAAAAAPVDTTVRTDFYLRLGVCCALLCALVLSFVVPLLFERYAGSARYILLFVALQSFQFIIFTELTFLMMRNRMLALIAAFVAANLVNFALAEILGGRMPFPHVMAMAVVCTALAAVAVMLHSRAVGLGGELLAGKLVTVISVLAATLLFSAAGIGWAVCFVAAWLFATVYWNWEQIRPLLPAFLFAQRSPT